MHTNAYWFSVPAHLTHKLDREELQGALLGTANLLGNLAPLELMCEPGGDLGVTAQIRSPLHRRAHNIYLRKISGWGGGLQRTAVQGARPAHLASTIHVKRLPPLPNGLPFLRRARRRSWPPGGKVLAGRLLREVLQVEPHR